MLRGSPAAVDVALHGGNAAPFAGALTSLATNVALPAELLGTVSAGNTVPGEFPMLLADLGSADAPLTCPQRAAQAAEMMADDSRSGLAQSAADAEPTAAEARRPTASPAPLPLKTD